MGIRASSTCPLTFTDVRVPATNVLGEVVLLRWRLHGIFLARRGARARISPLSDPRLFQSTKNVLGEVVTDRGI